MYDFRFNTNNMLVYHTEKGKHLNFLSMVKYIQLEARRKTYTYCGLEYYQLIHNKVYIRNRH